MAFASHARGEDVISFDAGRTGVILHDGRWKVACGDLWLADFGADEASARRALEVIQHYQMNEQRFVGNPSRVLAYYTCSGKAPSGPMAGEDAIPFQRGNLSVKQIAGTWKIVEGDHWIADFGSDEQAARDMLAAIDRFGFDLIAFVGRPGAPMTYFRASGENASAPARTATAPGAARLQVTVIEGGRGRAARPAVTLSPLEGGTPETLYENPARFDVPPGRYRVSARVGTGAESAPQDVILEAGRPVELTINTATGTLVLSLTAGGRPLNSAPNIILKSQAGQVAASSELPARFQAQEGDYSAEIAFAPSQVYRIPGLRIAAGATREVTAEVPCGVVLCRVAGSADRFPYVEVRNSAGLVAAQSDNPARFQLLAGDYRIGVRSGDRLLGARDVTLAPGQSAEIEIRP